MSMQKNAHLVAPHNIILNLTARCNLSCLHCFGDYGHIEELSIRQWKEIIDDLALNKIFYINITGGEPTQYPYFEEFIDYLGKKKMFFILTTNGIFSKKIMKTILKNKEYLINVKISLDGYDAKSNGFLRKKANMSSENLFSKTINTIKQFNKNSIPVSISTVLHSRNIKNLCNFIDLFKKIKVEKWLLSPITFIGRAEKNKEKLKYKLKLKSILQKVLISMRARLEKEGIYMDLVDFPLASSNKKFYFICGAAISFCEIHSNGIVSPCALSRVVMDRKIINFENILNKPLKEIWKGKLFNQFRAWQTTGCRGCNNLSKCNRCVPQSFLYFNNAEIPPPFCISIGRDLGLENINQLKNFGEYQKWQRR